MMSDKEVKLLVESAQNGDTDAFGKIYDDFAQQIHNFLLPKIRHKQTCEDMVHTVFLKAWTNLKNYKPYDQTKFSTWLFQIANYTLIDHWRVRKDSVPIDKIDNLLTFALTPKLYEDYEFLWIAISQLPLDQQTVLDLRFKQEMSVTETAAIMGKSQVAIRVLQHRALKALKDKLKDKV